MREEYATFADLQVACDAFNHTVNQRVHAVTKRVPAQQLTIEQKALHPAPVTPYAPAVGQVRRVPDNTPMVSFDNAQYSVPAHLLGQQVRVRTAGAGPDAEVVICHDPGTGLVEVARHPVAAPGSPAMNDTHFPGHDPKKTPGTYTPTAKTAAEAEFLALGTGAAMWLVEAAAAGATRIRTAMTDAITLARCHTTDIVDRALGHCATVGRFAPSDLRSVTAAFLTELPASYAAREHVSLAQGTSAWANHATTHPANTTNASVADHALVGQPTEPDAPRGCETIAQHHGLSVQPAERGDQGPGRFIAQHPKDQH